MSELSDIQYIEHLEEKVEQLEEENERLTGENKYLKDIVHYSNLDTPLIAVIGKAMENKRKQENE